MNQIKKVFTRPKFVTLIGYSLKQHLKSPVIKEDDYRIKFSPVDIIKYKKVTHSRGYDILCMYPEIYEEGIIGKIIETEWHENLKVPWEYGSKMTKICFYSNHPIRRTKSLIEMHLEPYDQFEKYYRIVNSYEDAVRFLTGKYI